MCPVTPSSKPNFENKRNEAASRSLRCRRSSSTLANLGGPGKPGFFTGAVAMCTSRKQNSMRTKYSTAPNAEKWNHKGTLEKTIIPESYFCALALADGILSESLLFVAHGCGRVSLEHLVHALNQGFCIKGRAHLRVIVEIHVDAACFSLPGGFANDALRVARLVPGGPRRDAARPGIYVHVFVAAGVQNFRAMQPHINEVGSEIHQARPFDGVRADQRNVVLAEQMNEFRHAKTLMANFQRVTKGHFHSRTEVGAIIQPVVTTACQSRGGFRVAR